ncbi:MAG: hypothetical protein A2020_02335 [Lentisphaerae bacterium GWF2_45_14]|nr:MAG: hypothetical protein A2020_02335 [Lentisphaerae bacterium GWF2_45_14]
MSYTAAIDISSGEAAFALRDNSSGKIVFTVYIKADRRDSSAILPGMLDALREHHIPLNAVEEWLTGTGPGSFTGLRIMSSIIAGLSFGKENVRVSGIPSSLALSSYAMKKCGNAKGATLFDGRNKEALALFAEKKNGIVESHEETKILGHDADFSKEFDAVEKLISIERDRASLEKILPLEIFNRVEFLEKFPVEEFFSDGITVRTGINDLIYVRPAVFVEPKKVREVS